MKGAYRFRNLQRTYALLPASLSMIGIGTLVATGAPVDTLLHGGLTALSFWQYFSLSIAISGAGYTLSLLVDERASLKMEQLVGMFRQSKREFWLEEAIFTVVFALLVIVVGFSAFFAVLSLLVHIVSLFFRGSAVVLATAVLWTTVSLILGLTSKRDDAEKRSFAQRISSQITSFLNICVTTSIYVTYGFWAAATAGLLSVALLLLPYFIYSFAIGDLVSGEATPLENAPLEDEAGR